MREAFRVTFGSRASASRASWCLAQLTYYLPNLSNSPLRAPPRNACHSSGVNLSTGPEGSLESRTPTPPSGRPATSTQLPLEKLRELLIQDRPAPDAVPGRSLRVELATSLPPECLGVVVQRCDCGSVF